MEGRIGTNCHVGAEHVVVNRAHHPDQDQLWVIVRGLLTDLALLYQLS